MYRYFLQKDCSQHLQPQQLDFMQQNPSAIHSGTGPIFILLLHDMLSVFQHLHVQWKLWQTKIKPHSKHLMWHVLFFDEKSELKHPAICCLLWLCFLYHYSGKENTCTPLPDKQWSQLEIFALPSEVTLYVTKDKKLLFFYFGFALNERWCKDCW